MDEKGVDVVVEKNKREKRGVNVTTLLLLLCASSRSFGNTLVQDLLGLYCKLL